MSALGYRVELELFNGPLDLLLYLVRRNEVDILELRIAEVARQFQRFIEVLEFLDLDVVGEFVVTASALIEIKSRLALPQEVDEDVAQTESTEDPRSDLVNQLLEYKRYKDAAKALEERAFEWQQRYPRLSDDRPVVNRDPSADFIREVELWDLVSALGRLLETKEVAGESTIQNDATPLKVYIQRVGDRVREEGGATFSSFFEGAHDRYRIVGVFLAILELLRHHGFTAEQSRIHGEIVITAPPEPPPGTLPASES